MYGRLISVAILLMLLSSTVLAITPEEKVYFDQQNQKTIAQLSQKIDTQTNRVEQDLKTEVEKVKEEVKEEMKKEVNSALKGVAVGLAGLIIVTLAMFKVIDLRLSSSKNIKKYEEQLIGKKKEYDDMINSVKQDTERVINYKTQLIIYHQQLQAFATGIGGIPQPVSQLPPAPAPIPVKKKRRFLFFKRK